MKTRLLLLVLTFFWAACQSTDPTPFGIDPQLEIYSDEGPIAQKLFCNSVNCENPFSQEMYSYNPAGQLTRVDQFSRSGSGKLELVFYTEYHYAPTGQLSGKIRYGRQSDKPGWVSYDESEYVYTAEGLTQERTYFNQHDPDQRIFTGKIDFEFNDGKKVGQRWYDAQQNLSYRVMSEYRNNTLVRETWFGATDNVLRRFEHQFAANRRQISEYMPKLTGPVSVVEKTYDTQGRLSSEETKVINPVLCSMQAGVVRYVY